jgi:phage terminase large subunit
MPNVDFSYYKPINAKQEAFHNSLATHRLLLGGFGGGKTYPALHEVYRHIYQNDYQDFLMLKNTWDTVRQHLLQEALEIGYGAGAIKSYEKTDAVITMHNNSRLLFRPLTMQRKDLKGLNICGFFCDDPNVDRFEDTISFLFTRMRNSAVQKIKAVSFKSIFTANYEGHNWLWKTFIQDRKEGEDKNGFAYWIISTAENSTLPPDYISNLAAIHSDTWMNRYVYMQHLETFSGLVYPEFNLETHHKDCAEMDEPNADGLIRILAVDVGFNVTVVLKMATDGERIYVYDEWYQQGITSGTLAEWLREECARVNYRAVVIDPTSAKGEQTSGMSVKDDLRRNYGLRVEGGSNSVRFGIMTVKDLLKPATGEPYLMVYSGKCRFLVKEFSMYRRKEPKEALFDDLGYLDEPEKKNDHALDAMRYGVLYLKKYLRNMVNREEMLEKRRQELWNDRMNKLRIYRDRPELAIFQRQKEMVRRRLKIEGKGYIIDKLKKRGYTITRKTRRGF